MISLGFSVIISLGFSVSSRSQIGRMGDARSRGPRACNLHELLLLLVGAIAFAEAVEGVTLRGLSSTGTMDAGAFLNGRILRF